MITHIMGRDFFNNTRGTTHIQYAKMADYSHICLMRSTHPLIFFAGSSDAEIRLTVLCRLSPYPAL
jgi:hypothetical protein